MQCQARASLRRHPHLQQRSELTESAADRVVRLGISLRRCAWQPMLSQHAPPAPLEDGTCSCQLPGLPRCRGPVPVTSGRRWVPLASAGRAMAEPRLHAEGCQAAGRRGGARLLWESGGRSRWASRSQRRENHHRGAGVSAGLTRLPCLLGLLRPVRQSRKMLYAGRAAFPLDCSAMQCLLGVHGPAHGLPWPAGAQVARRRGAASRGLHLLPSAVRGLHDRGDSVNFLGRTVSGLG